MLYICDAGLLKYTQKKCIGEFIGFGYQTESDFEKIEIIVTKFFYRLNLTGSSMITHMMICL